MRVFPVLAPLCLAAAVVAQLPQTTFYETRLSGEFLQTGSPGRGWATTKLVFDPRVPNHWATVFVHTEDTAGTVNAVEWRDGPGGTGPLIVNLSRFSETWQGFTTVTPSQAASIESGNTSLLVRTSTLSSGEMSGRLVPGTGSTFEYELTGTTVPDTGGRALLIEPVNLLVVSPDLTALTGPAQLELWNGNPGQGTRIATEPVRVSNGREMVGFDLTDNQVLDLRLGNLHLNVVTPTSQARGAILREVLDFGAAEIGSSQVVPAIPASPATGFFCMEPSRTAARLDFDYDFALDWPSARAEIRNAPSGSTGPLVSTLTQISPIAYRGKIGPLSPQEKNDLDAGNWYVQAYDGAGNSIARGQIRQAPLATAFGVGCANTPGATRPVLAAVGAACRGGTLDLRIAKAPPNAFVVLNLGFRRDEMQFAPGVTIPLPLPFGFFGVRTGGGCFLLVEPGIAVSLVTNGLGRAALSIGLPASLRGTFYFQAFPLAATPQSTNGLQVSVQ